jgi:alpha/beta superfamily hydrolase
MRQKTIFIIPGYKHRPDHKAYKEIAKMFKKEGYHPISVKIPWKDSTISENTQYFLKKYKKVTARKKYILGFSFGAMIAFLASTKVKTHGLILCSLSPYFKEDLINIDITAKTPMTRLRYYDFSSLHCKSLSKQIKAKQILMLYGLNEEKSLIKRVRKTYNHIDSEYKYLMPIKETEHNIASKKYLFTIHQATKE